MKKTITIEIPVTIPDYDGLPVEMVEGDPINAAYCAAIKAEDVPEWVDREGER